MKFLVAVLIVLVALLSLALWKRDSSAGASLVTADAALSAVSNKLAEARMQVTHQEQLAAVAQAGLDSRTRELAAMSNNAAILNADLVNSRAETVVARGRAQDFQVRVAASEAQSASQANKLEELATQVRNLNVVIAQTQSNATQFESARAALANEAECLKIEKLALTRQLNDPVALRLQLRRLKSRAQPLELHPNDSVGLSPAPQSRSGDASGQPQY